MSNWHWYIELGESAVLKGVRRFSLAWGVRFGYWPCLSAPFLDVSWGKWRVRVWHGACSYKAQCRRHF